MEKIRNTKVSKEEASALLETLRIRFEKNPKRHKGIEWKTLEARVKKSPKKLLALFLMEETGGEPDVVSLDKKTGEYVFMDCSEESPKGRRSLCYDKEGLESRKEHQPESSALDMAKQMGVEILTEAEYRTLQKLGAFDLKTSTWIATPASIRKLGGALFCDRRYDTVFTYHNGAQSYYASRAFRGSLRV